MTAPMGLFLVKDGKPVEPFNPMDRFTFDKDGVYTVQVILHYVGPPIEGKEEASNHVETNGKMDDGTKKCDEG